MKKLKNAYYLIIISLITSLQINAQEIENDITNNVINDFQSRASFSLSLKPVENLKVYIVPEIRLSENFSVDKALLETELEWSPLKYIEFGGSYRFVINPKVLKETEYLHKFGLSTTFKTDIQRFKPSVKLSWTNYADDNVYDNFLRYKANLKYDIKNCKITPNISAQIFHQIKAKQIYKVRYKIGLDYKLFKNNYIGLNYKFDYYMQEYLNKHIISLSYKIKL